MTAHDAILIGFIVPIVGFCSGYIIGLAVLSFL